MRWLIIPMVLATDTGYPPLPLNEDPKPAEEQSNDDIEDCEKGVTDLKNSVLGLEFFLQDKKDFKTYCPYVKWEQPKLEEYKKEPKSYLPKECKENKI